MKGFCKFGLVEHIEFSELNELIWGFEKQELVERGARDEGLYGLCGFRGPPRLSGHLCDILY